MFGPLSGDLLHDPYDGKMESERAGISTADMFAGATFINPYSAATDSWNYGFIIRDDRDTVSGRFMYLVVTSERKWRLRWRDRSTKRTTTIAEGLLPPYFDTLASGRNTLWAATFGERGMFFVNGEWVSTLDLSDIPGPGDVAVVTGVFKDDEVAGAVTKFEDFQVRPLEWIYGPVSGTIERGSEEISTHSSEFRALELVTEATFTSPPARSWGYGFKFGSAGTSWREVIFVEGNNNWRHEMYRDGEFITVASGPLSHNLRDNNHLLLILLGNTGYFVVNGQPVPRLELSYNLDHSDPSIVVGIYKVETGELEFDNFSVWMPR